jgi:hypothetical protein
MLQYFIKSSHEFSDDIIPIKFENGVGDFFLQGNILRVQPAPNQESDYKEEIDGVLKAWSLECEICSYYDLSFIYEGEGNVDELNNLTPHPRKQYENDRLVIEWNRYPDPPSIRLTPEIIAIWERFRFATSDIREPFQSAVYYALSIVDQAAGGRKKASKLYNVDLGVLRKLGELSSIRGDIRTARKALPKDALPLSRNERHWMDYVTRILILQMGQVAAGILPEKIIMENLPELG